MEELSQKAKNNNVNCYIDGVYFQVGNLFDKMNVTMYLYKNLENKNYFIYSKINQELIEDDSILMNWCNLTNNYKSSLIKKLNTIDSTYDQVYITLESESTDGLLEVTESMFQIKEWDLLEQENMRTKNYMQKYQNKMLFLVMVILLCFSIICAITVSSLWVYRREREYLICRAFGYSIVQIVGSILKEVFCVFIVAAGFGSIIELGYLYIHNKGRITFMEEELMALAVIMPLLFMIIIAYPCVKIRKSVLTQGSIDSMNC